MWADRCVDVRTINARDALVRRAASTCCEKCQVWSRLRGGDVSCFCNLARLFRFSATRVKFCDCVVFWRPRIECEKATHEIIRQSASRFCGVLCVFVHQLQCNKQNKNRHRPTHTHTHESNHINNINTHTECLLLKMATKIASR